ncbi:MAG: outer membrane beta-barrel protein [Capnocytophaga sp.]|nr:outer membrane beta-barrel protein [Capnocytophaga sp.]
MRKRFILTALILFTLQSFAQVRFTPGVKAGLTLSQFSGEEDRYFRERSSSNHLSFSIKPDFYLGLLGTIDFTRFYALQPEILYQRQGSKVSFSNQFTTTNVQLSYLSLAVANKFKFRKISLQVVPSLDFLVDKNYDIENDTDVSVALGIGYQINRNWGVEARAKWGAVPVMYSTSNRYRYSDEIAHGNFSFQIGLTYSFTN